MLASREVGANQRNIIGLALKLELMGAFGSAPDRNAGSLQQVQSDMGIAAQSSAWGHSSGAAFAKAVAALIALGLLLGGCFQETYHKGYILPEGALEQIPIGSSQEQVLLVLGTPSTVATVSGEAYYYISQSTERLVGFMPQVMTDQRVIAVYFDKHKRVERLADYRMKDGRVFDFVSRTTPTGGKETGILTGMLTLNPFGGTQH
jgi:outer membrane protein assembly factor BamE (lipoprotein component of BamABCDE complex)